MSIFVTNKGTHLLIVWGNGCCKLCLASTWCISSTRNASSTFSGILTTTLQGGPVLVYSIFQRERKRSREAALLKADVRLGYSTCHLALSALVVHPLKGDGAGQWGQSPFPLRNCRGQKRQTHLKAQKAVIKRQLLSPHVSLQENSAQSPLAPPSSQPACPATLLWLLLLA